MASLHSTWGWVGVGGEFTAEVFSFLLGRVEREREREDDWVRWACAERRMEDTRQAG